MRGIKEHGVCCKPEEQQVSSANMTVIISVISGRLAMSRYRTGLRTQPCGTPARILWKDRNSLLCLT